MPRMPIRFILDGDGFWYQILDADRRVIATAWLSGKRSAAKREAHLVRANLRARAKEAAYINAMDDEQLVILDWH